MQTTQKPIMMLRSLKDFIGNPIEATDGSIGKCRDFLFDMEHWTVRYLVADTRKWLPGRQVLISPHLFGDPNLGSFPVGLTKERIKESPPLETDQPVSRLHELEMARFYGQPPYWIGPGTWGAGFAPVVVERPPHTAKDWEEHARELRQIDLKGHLRSAGEVLGYSLSAIDEDIGRVDDFVIESLSWTIRWIIVDVGNWLSGRKVIMSPEWVQNIDWHRKCVSVDVLAEQVKKAPEFDHRLPVNRDYEGRLCDYYGKRRYWE